MFYQVNKVVLFFSNYFYVIYLVRILLINTLW